jgi:hypothetical protein
LEEVEDVAMQKCMVLPRLMPAGLRECLAYLSKPKNINTEGLFRIVGQKSFIDEFYEKAKKKDFKLPPSVNSPHNVGGLLKQLLREDCQPIITNDLAPLFTAAVCCVFE